MVVQYQQRLSVLLGMVGSSLQQRLQKSHPSVVPATFHLGRIPLRDDQLPSAIPMVKVESH
jgi:hypothetical protein